MNTEFGVCYVAFDATSSRLFIVPQACFNLHLKSHFFLLLSRSRLLRFRRGRMRACSVLLLHLLLFCCRSRYLAHASQSIIPHWFWCVEHFPHWVGRENLGENYVVSFFATISISFTFITSPFLTVHFNSRVNSWVVWFLNVLKVWRNESWEIDKLLTIRCCQNQL